MDKVMIRTQRHLKKDLSKYRTLFPHTEDRVYLNHAALSPMH